MLLCNLLEGINILKCNTEMYKNVENIANDHRRIEKKYAFVAIMGEKQNGNLFIKQALERGATAIITDCEEACSDNIPYVLVENARLALALMWSNFYGAPAKHIKTIAITGTNGKTSTSYFLYNILRAGGVSCGLISTIDWLVNGEEITIENQEDNKSYAMTTPDPEVLYYLYNKMKEKNVEVVVLEVSSHALVQSRLAGIEVEIGAYTNLSREHLDYHQTMEEYYSAKKLLVDKSQKFIVNFDDNYGKRIKNEYFKKVKCASVNEISDFHVENLIQYDGICEYDFCFGKERVRVKMPHMGVHNVYNSVIAASCACIFGVESEAIKKGIEETKMIRGRCEKYRDKPIYIDYAHTPVAMKAVLNAIKQTEPQKRLICLFGCGGQRDKGKRAEMAEISAEYADFTVITGDNPRNEPPNEIIADILRGFNNYDEYIVVPNRKKAIKYACEILGVNDVLLLLGKGHEAYEIIGNKKVFFDERKILDEVFLES